MGHTQAAGMKEAGGVNEMTLSWHLTSNHYPPVPTSMVPVCLKAIKYANDEQYEQLVELPDGITFRDAPEAPAHEIVTKLHLEAFLD